MSKNITILPMRKEHWQAVREIYQQGMDTGLATLEITTGTWEKWDKTHLKSPRLISVFEKKTAGWAALSPVSGRCVYGGVAEVSVYVRETSRGKGIGLSLLNELVRQSEGEGLWTLQAGIFAENKPSIRLHEKAGFRIVGVREKLGKLHGQWKDIVLMERRSTFVGING